MFPFILHKAPLERKEGGWGKRKLEGEGGFLFILSPLLLIEEKQEKRKESKDMR